MLNLRSVHATNHHDVDATFTQGHVDFIQSNILGDLAAIIDYDSSSLSEEEELIPGSPTDVESEAVTPPGHVSPKKPYVPPPLYSRTYHLNGFAI